MMALHLDSGPRDDTPLCGSDTGPTTTEINEVDCPDCVTAHDRLQASL